jgi:PAS domain S-box-containing protein
MKDGDKPKKQLINELADLRQRIAESEASEAKRRQAEEALKKSLEQIEQAKQEWESTVDSLSQLVCLLDDQRRIIRANRTVENWNLGWVVEVKGREVHELFHPGCTDPTCYLETFWLQAWAELAQGRPAECEAEDRVLRRHLSIQVRPISTQMDGEHKEAASFAVAIVHDITERKRAEAERERLLTALKHRSTQLQTAAEVSKSITTILDPEELMNQTVNLIQERFGFYYVGLFLVDEAGQYAVLRAGTGKAGRQMLKAGHRLLVGGESMIGWSVAHAQARIALDVGKEAVRFDNPHLPETRSELALPLISHGQCIGALAVQSTEEAAFSEEDIAVLQTMADQLAVAIENARLYAEKERRTTTLAHALEQQQELERLQSEFIQNVSHELRTPLTIAQGYAELLDCGELGELQPAQRESVAVIARQVRMLVKMVDDLTTILVAETHELSPESVDLVNLVHTLVDDFQVAAQRAGLSLAAEVASDVPQVSGDADHLRRVLDNLLYNALKFTPAGGSVTVRLWGNGMNVVLEVTDTGIGIPHDQLERIFERFYQVDGSTTRDYGGTGLGLALVKEIVEAYGGKVSVESKVGRGSTFTVTLPSCEG